MQLNVPESQNDDTIDQTMNATRNSNSFDGDNAGILVGAQDESVID